MFHVVFLLVMLFFLLFYLFFLLKKCIFVKINYYKDEKERINSIANRAMEHFAHN